MPNNYAINKSLISNDKNLAFDRSSLCFISRNAMISLRSVELLYWSTTESQLVEHEYACRQNTI